MSRPVSSGRQTIVQRLAAWACAIDEGDLGESTIRQAKLLVLDSIGCGLAASEDETARAAIGYIRAAGGAPQCSVIGLQERTNISNAVLANGVLIRTLDLNDYVVEPDGGVGGHPSDIIPVAWAVAEASGRSGREALAAIVLGYEVYWRLKSAMAHKSPWDGVSVTGGAAPVIAGRLLGLSPEQMAHAIAASLSYAAVSATVRTGEISGAKNIANAWVAEHGVRSTYLAQRGITGPLAIFEDPRGMKAVFPEVDKKDPIDAPLSDPFISHASIKVFPCIATGQSTVAACLSLHEACHGALGEIERMTVTMVDHPTIRGQQQDQHRRDPHSREAADHSFPFLAAVALRDGVFGLSSFDGERWRDPELQDLMGRMDMTTSPDLAARAAPRSFPAVVELRMRDGRVHKVEVLTPPGYGGASLDEETVARKFLASAEPAIGGPHARKLLDDIMAIDDGRSCADALAGIRAH